MVMAGLVVSMGISCARPGPDSGQPAPAPGSPAPSTSATPAQSAAPFTSSYPYILRPLAPDRLAALRQQFARQNPGTGMDLDEYGYVGKTNRRQHPTTRIDDPEAVVQKAKDWLLKNRAFTGVSSEADLQVASFQESKQRIPGTQAWETNELRIFFKDQTWQGLPVLLEGYGCRTVVNAGRDGVQQVQGHWFGDIRVPSQPKIDESALRRQLVGKHFGYSDIGGSPRSVTATAQHLTTPASRAVYVKQGPQGLEFHLAWVVTVGSGMSWTACYDAITGEELGIKANFVCLNPLQGQPIAWR